MLREERVIRNACVEATGDLFANVISARRQAHNLTHGRFFGIVKRFMVTAYENRATDCDDLKHSFCCSQSVSLNC